MNSTNDSNANRVLLLVGPTAVGKTELSLELAERLNAEIVSADSRQVYRWLDIGTAKPTAAEQKRVRHHFIDIRTPDSYYSAGEYGHEARECIAQLLQHGKCPLVVGGSGFYLRALVDGLSAPSVSDAQVREKWRRFYREQGAEAAHQALANVDAESAARLHPNDVQRVVRALEVNEIAGLPISQFRSGQEEAADFSPVFVGLWRNRSHLYERIEQRVLNMLADGLVQEVEQIQVRGYGPELNALCTVGYQEVFAWMRGKWETEQMVQEIQKNSRHYAKRQLTWFRREPRIQWIDLDAQSPAQALAAVLEVWRTAG